MARTTTSRKRTSQKECRSAGGAGVQDERGPGRSAVLVGAAAIHSELLNSCNPLTPSEQFFFSPARCSLYRTRYETRLVAYPLDLRRFCSDSGKSYIAGFMAK